MAWVAPKKSPERHSLKLPEFSSAPAPKRSSTLYLSITSFSKVPEVILFLLTPKKIDLIENAVSIYDDVPVLNFNAVDDNTGKVDSLFCQNSMRFPIVFASPFIPSRPSPSKLGSLRGCWTWLEKGVKEIIKMCLLVNHE